MKITWKKNNEAGGAILTTTICSFALLSFLVVSYLWMVMGQNKAVERSQHWNAALAIAEAGIDEGMAHMNYNFGTNVNLATNGWKLNGSSYGPMVRSLKGGSYSVIISKAALPTVTSTATIIDKLNSMPIRRTVQVTTAPNFAFPVGLTVKSNATLVGTGPVINSDVASIYGNVGIQNGKVKGGVKTGSGSVTVGPNGSYQTKTNNFYTDLADVSVPYSFGKAPPAGLNPTLAADTQYWVNGPYNVTSLTIAGSNVTLYVTGNFSVNTLTNKPNASFTLYVGSTDLTVGTSATFGGNSGDKVNAGGDPGQFTYYGLPNNTKITLKNGLNTFNANVYAPEVAFVQNGNQTFFGALVAKSYSANGNSIFTYDPRLARSPTVIGFVVASWREIPPP